MLKLLPDIDLIRSLQTPNWHYDSDIHIIRRKLFGMCIQRELCKRWNFNKKRPEENALQVFFCWVGNGKMKT